MLRKIIYRSLKLGVFCAISVAGCRSVNDLDSRIKDVDGPVESPILEEQYMLALEYSLEVWQKFGFKPDNNCGLTKNYRDKSGRRTYKLELYGSSCAQLGQPIVTLSYLVGQPTEVSYLVFTPADNKGSVVIGSVQYRLRRDDIYTAVKIIDLCTNDFAGVCNAKVDKEGRLTAIEIIRQEDK